MKKQTKTNNFPLTQVRSKYKFDSFDKAHKPSQNRRKIHKIVVPKLCTGIRIPLLDI